MFGELLGDRTQPVQNSQMQKMESIGRLAGGVAHDFNNLLTTIIGYSEMIESSLDPNDDITKHVAEFLLAGTETVLLAEDEDQVRLLIKKILTKKGYHVLEANNGGSVYLKCKGYEKEIHLLLADVMMPVTNGRELHEQIASIRPGIKVLYLSGYTDNAIIQRGVLAEDAAFLQKPFSAADLLRKVRAALER